MAIYKELTPKQVVEIGSLTGETLKHWIANAETGATIVSVDQIVPPHDGRWEEQKFGHEVRWPQYASNHGCLCYMIDADSRSGYAISTVVKLVSTVDFLFIDGGHDYDTCMADYRNYAPLVRPGGIIAFHDLGNEWPDVRKVWDKVKKNHVRAEEFVTSPTRYGIGVLHV